MSDSVFDPNTFLDAPTEESFTKRPPIPAGSELLGVIGEPRTNSFQGKGNNAGKTYYKVFIPVQLDLTSNPEIRALVGQDIVTLTDDMFLDIDENGKLDSSPGRNTRLRSYRIATDLNEPGTPFTIRALQGRTVKVRVKQQEGLDGEPRDMVAAVSRP